ncbi:MAG: type II toxin-antitoxin system RelE/ParE family toxin [Planctomycetaceae bacterium]|jgi:putative component of toxin-antitoxin plasmid stabilization module|nr:type II toxin-antitoxin system RelE/ParE family toxin [Planctomycetaceae bacterium]
MPQTAVGVYQESPDEVPPVDWLASLSEKKKIRAKCRTKIDRLAELGELRRPEADYLRDGIYELRIGYRGMNYRILYAFAGHQIALLTHGILKEDRVPSQEIENAVICKQKWEKNRKVHTFQKPL